MSVTVEMRTKQQKTKDVTRNSQCSAKCVEGTNIKEGMSKVKLQNKFLQCHTEYSYFEKEYVKHCNKKGHVTYICSICSSIIVNKLK